MLDKSNYQPAARFTDEYLRWLDAEGLLCADDTVQGWRCNFEFLSLPAVFNGDEIRVQESIDHVRQLYDGNYGEVWWMGEVEGPKKRGAYTLARNYWRNAIEGIGQLFRARDAVRNQDEARALMFLCNAAQKLGAAHGLWVSMTDHAKKATLSARRAALANVEIQAHGVQSKHMEWVTAARKLLATGRDPHEISTMIAARNGYSARQVRTVLQRAGLVTVRKAKTKNKKREIS